MMKHASEKRVQSIGDLVDALRDVIETAVDLTSAERADAAALD